MANQGENNTKLGIFVLSGLMVLMITFYMIGKNHTLFGNNFNLKVRFANLNGLTEGSNVMFAGLQAGTVKNIQLINDTSIEVTLLIDDKIKDFVRKNALASIGTDGLMGNKVVNIVPVNQPMGKVENGDMLMAKKAVNMDQMLQTLSKTNSNIADISEGLKTTVLSINKSSVMGILNNKNIGSSLSSSLKNINKATLNASQITASINEMVLQAKSGKGTLGILLADTTTAGNLREAIAKIRMAGDNVNHMTSDLNKMVLDINHNLTSGKGTLNTLLRDTTIAKNLKASMDNIQKGTDAFNQDMEALKHNFLFSGYFKKLEKQQAKDKK